MKPSYQQFTKKELRSRTPLTSYIEEGEERERKEIVSSEDSSFGSCDISEYTSEAPLSASKKGNNKKGSRKIKDVVQLQLLEEFFALDPEWSKSTIKFISGFMTLTKLQLYKWGYDQKRKNTYKKGIRNKIRESRRRKFSENSVTDYNTMVSELFPEEEDKLNSPVDDFTDKFEQLKVKYFNTINGEYLEKPAQIVTAQVEKRPVKSTTPDVECNPFDFGLGESANMGFFNDFYYQEPSRTFNSSGLESYKFERLF